jgi:hypothetical protein
MRKLATVLALLGVLLPLPLRTASADDTGYLDVASDPPAEIFIDDGDTGKVTPQPKLTLPAGHHRLTLVTSDNARKRTIGFRITAGETTKLTIHLAASSAP